MKSEEAKKNSRYQLKINALEKKLHEQKQTLEKWKEHRRINHFFHKKLKEKLGAEEFHRLLQLAIIDADGY